MQTKRNKLKDIEIIRKYLDTRNASYFDLLYERYSSKVYAKCISILKNEARAQDATQEIFTKIFLNLAKFQKQSKFSTWLYSITYNYCIDQVRKKKKESDLFSDDIERVPDNAEDDVDDEVLLSMEIDRLKIVLDEIPEGDKAILMMKYSEEMSIMEIASTMEKSESAVKMRLLRAKQKARNVYKKLFKK